MFNHGRMKESMIAMNSAEHEEAIKLSRFFKLHIQRDLSPMQKCIDCDQEPYPEIS